MDGANLDHVFSLNIVPRVKAICRIGQPFLRADANFLRIAAKIGSRGGKLNAGPPVAEPHLEQLAIWVRQLAEELAKQGHPVGQLLTRAGISERALQAKDARIPFTKNAAFFELAAEATDNSRASRAHSKHSSASFRYSAAVAIASSPARVTKEGARGAPSFCQLSGQGFGGWGKPLSSHD